jgi:hypothetical protein
MPPRNGYNTECKQCGRELPPPSRPNGRKREYCGENCKKKFLRLVDDKISIESLTEDIKRLKLLLSLSQKRVKELEDKYNHGQFGVKK